MKLLDLHRILPSDLRLFSSLFASNFGYVKCSDHLSYADMWFNNFLWCLKTVRL